MDWQRIQALWNGKGTVAFVEIFLLFLIIYLFLRFLRSSRGAPVLRGILLIIGLFILTVFLTARLFQLEHITWVFERSAAVFFVSLMIIFQPELRRGLLRLGMHPMFHRFVRASSPAIDEIVESVTMMSQQSIGALIAIERQVPLTPFMENGTPLNAEITKLLLRTLFHSGTPLHDGAVIIQGSRMAAAGCILPLTENPEFSKLLGTRHRAGMAISEQTDAVAVVVSEETGKISLVVDGKLSQGISPAQLRKQLTELCIESVEGGD